MKTRVGSDIIDEGILDNERERERDRERRRMRTGVDERETHVTPSALKAVQKPQGLIWTRNFPFLTSMILAYSIHITYLVEGLGRHSATAS